MDRLPKHLYYSDGAENDIETLFVLESPCKDELYWEFPCMGKTGIKMSEILAPNDAGKPIGVLIQHNNPQTRKYALFETFKFPLDAGLTHGLDADELFWKMIKNKRSKEAIKNFFEQNRQFFSFSYRFNLECAIKIFHEKLNEIVVCGDIAQGIFEKVFDDRLNSYQNTDSIGVVFIEHPAKAVYDRNRQWQYQANLQVNSFFSI